MKRAKGAKAFRVFRGSELPADHDPYQRQIDALVNGLYGLREEEITLVDGEHQSR